MEHASSRLSSRSTITAFAQTTCLKSGQWSGREKEALKPLMKRYCFQIHTLQRKLGVMRWSLVPNESSPMLWRRACPWFWSITGRCAKTWSLSLASLALASGAAPNGRRSGTSASTPTLLSQGTCMSAGRISSMVCALRSALWAILASGRTREKEDQISEGDFAWTLSAI